MVHILPAYIANHRRLFYDFPAWKYKILRKSFYFWNCDSPWEKRDKRRIMMKDKSPVNIVVPVYNVADLLSRCVDSLLAQTYEDVRIVLVDDGSTDDCPAICDRYAEQDPRVTSLHRTNGGLSAARNTGIDHVFSIEEPSRGRYIAFVDSDDWVEPGYVESMLETLEESGADAAQCGHFISYAPDNEDDKDPAHTRTTLDRAQAVESLCRNGLWDVTAWNKLYRLDLFRQIRYPEGLLYRGHRHVHT